MRIYELLGNHAPTTTPVMHSRYPLAVGIEVELESVRGPELYALNGWSVHNDMSLRDGMEFVFAGPGQGDTVAQRIDTLSTALEEFQVNPRTSTHVHVDMSWSTTEHLRTLFFFMYAFDEVLFELFDPGRKWCGYCCTLTEMEPDKLQAVITSIADPERCTLLNVLHRQRNQDRYYGFNIQALIRHSTVEFRHFPGGILGDRLGEVVRVVTNIVLNTTDVSLDALHTAAESAKGTEDLLRRVLGDSFSDEIMRYSDMFRDTLSDGLALLPDSDATPTRDNSLVFYNPIVAKWYQRARGIPNENMEQFDSTFKLMACVTFAELDNLAVTMGGQEPGRRGMELDACYSTPTSSLGWDSDTYDHDEEDEDEEFN